MIQHAPNVFRADRMAGLFAPAVVDLFAGAGGWSIGAERAFVRGGFRDRYIDLMVNHWDVAVGVHEANHPMTEHLHASVWEVDPNAVLLGRRIVYLHASPDCTDFSKAKGSRPKRKHIRALADVVLVWAGKRRPDVITLENVEEFKDRGPLGPDGQPDKTRRGDEFRRWKGELEALGYVVEHRELRACDYGAPTTRKRLFVVARCDGKPIVWPTPTHGSLRGHAQEHRSPSDVDRCVREYPIRRAGAAGSVARNAPDSRTSGEIRQSCLSDRLQLRRNRLDRPEECRSDDVRARRVDGVDQADLRSVLARSPLEPYRTAAQCIDWSIPMLSIFATREEAKAWAKLHGAAGIPQRPLKPKTMERIARGLVKFVINAKRPFIVDIENSTWAKNGTRDVAGPLNTVTATPKGGKHAVVDAMLAPYTAGVGGRAGQSPATSANAPIPTVTGKADRVVAAAHLAPYTVQRYGERPGQAPRCNSIEEPTGTITSTGNQATLVAAFLSTYYGNTKDAAAIDKPSPTVTGKDRIQLVTVVIDGQTYVITDIAMRMLTPRELARCQGFPNDYVLERTVAGTPVTKADQVKLIGNSVPPPFAEAIVYENVVRAGVLDERPIAAGGVA